MACGRFMQSQPSKASSFRGCVFSGDGGAFTTASLYSPLAVAADRAGNVSIVDAGRAVFDRRRDMARSDSDHAATPG